MAKLRLWRWRAIDEQGKIHRGALLAEERQAVSQALLEQRFQLLSLTKAASNRRSGWQQRHKIDLLRQLATLLQAGIPLVEALELIARQHPVAECSALLLHIGQQISQGVPLSAALQRWPSIFPPLFITLIRTGELTGKLAECCQRLAEQQEQQYRLRSKVVKALRYPLFILLAVLLVSIGMVVFVLPEFASIYSTFNAPLPGLTLAVLALSEWVGRRGIWCGLLIIICASGWLAGRRRASWQEAEQHILLRLPLLAPLWRGQILSQIFTVLALSLHAGIPLLQGLETLEKNLPQRLWQKKIRYIGHRVAGGIPLWQAVDSSAYFTPLCVQLIRTGEESGALDLMLERLANWHHDKTLELADNLAAALEPLIMLLIGLIVGTLVVAMYLPVFQLGEALAGG